MVHVLRRRGRAAARPWQAGALADHDVAGHRVAALDLGDHLLAGLLGGHVGVGDDLDVRAPLLSGHDRLGGRGDVPAEHRDPQRVALPADLKMSMKCRTTAGSLPPWVAGEEKQTSRSRRCCSRKSGLGRLRRGRPRERTSEPGRDRWPRDAPRPLTPRVRTVRARLLGAARGTGGGDHQDRGRRVRTVRGACACDQRLIRRV